VRTVIFIFSFLSFNGYTKDFSFEEGHLKYKMSYDEKSIHYRDEATELSLTKKTCNSHIIERIKNKLDGYFKKPFLEDSRPEFLKIIMDGKTFYQPRYGERAVFLMTMPDEIKKLKIEESFNCGKN
jgi:hypothetical protein